MLHIYIYICQQYDILVCPKMPAFHISITTPINYRILHIPIFRHTLMIPYGEHPLKITYISDFDLTETQ